MSAESKPNAAALPNAPRVGRVALWSNLSLVVLALGTSAAAIATSDWIGSGEVMGREQHLLKAFRAEQVSEIALDDSNRHVVFRRASNEAGAKTSLSKAGRSKLSAEAEETADESSEDVEAKWFMLEPQQGNADPAQLEELLRAVHFATFLRRIAPEDVDRSALGLEKPALQITLRNGKTARILRLGKAAPSPRGARYLELGGAGVEEAGVYVVSESTAQNLLVTPESFRMRQLISYSASEFGELMFQREGTPLVLEQRGNGDYFFKGRLGNARVARDVVERLLLGFARAQLDPVVAVTEARGVLSRDAVSLELHPKNTKSETLKLLVGGTCPEHPERNIAIRERPDPIAGCVPSLNLDDLFLDPQLAIDRGLFHLRADEVESLRVETDSSKLELVREGETFRMRAPGEALLDKDLGTRRLQAVLGLRGDWLESAPTPAPAGPATYRVAITSSASTDADIVEELVDVWSKAPGPIFARRKADGAWLKLTEAAARVLAPNTLLLRERELVKYSAERLRSIAIKSPRGRQVLTRNEGGEFQLVEPANFRLDATLVADLTDSITQMHAEEWVAERDDGRYGFEKPRLELELVDDKGNVRLFVVGAKANFGSYFAKDRSTEAVFTLKANTVETLSRWVLDRSGFGFDPETVLEVKLGGKRGRLVFRRLGEEYLQTAGDYNVGNSGLVALVEALSMIRPDAAIALDDRDYRYGFALPSLELEVSLLGGKSVRWALGVADMYENSAVYYGHVIGQSVVYVVPRGMVERVFEAL